MQPLENHKYTLGVLRLNTDTVIADGKPPAGILTEGADFNLGGLVTSEFYGVADEVLEQSRKLQVVEIDGRQIISGNFCTRFLYARLKTYQRLVEGLFGIYLLRFFALCADARLFEQAVDKRLHSFGAVYGKIHIFGCFFVEMLFEVSSQQLDKAGDRPQRLL